MSDSLFTDAQIAQIRQIVREELAAHPASGLWHYQDGEWHIRPLPPVLVTPAHVDVIIDDDRRGNQGVVPPAAGATNTRGAAQ